MSSITVMTTTPERPGNAPIFEVLIQEHGDVLAEAREAAQATESEAARALDWSDLHPAAEDEDE
ncbi:hypothetical protein [Streptomyces gobiensis]|uniref:hypothetical protein n=1 Tax=Streptomyces gobiensis TaxID=2875706 RepID=UPI001E49EEDE|nr:hypothetical protein [Streptomyces gobiensis]UGY95328.1 hypothetical protein test1122_15925 [Streptomyces gobiensis]